MYQIVAQVQSELSFIPPQESKTENTKGAGICTGCFKKSFKTLKAYINLFRDNVAEFYLG
jgi:hypothetical protein